MTERYTVGAVAPGGGSKGVSKKRQTKKEKMAMSRIEPSTCGIEKESNRFIDDEP